MVIEETPYYQQTILLTYSLTDDYVKKVREGFLDTPFEGDISAQTLELNYSGIDGLI